MTSYPSHTNNLSTTTVSSTQTLVPTKDYASAFANLQSKYGFGGNAPSPNPNPDTQGEDKALTDGRRAMMDVEEASCRNSGYKLRKGGHGFAEWALGMSMGFCNRENLW
ncbi:hypothetical protein F5146DRAFT_1122031 [Armillaria mellea]|nr:hypothetical protein F5146DRAFT_1122031 [Armillaria mellea]